jgi:hypothetical protein
VKTFSKILFILGCVGVGSLTQAGCQPSETGRTAKPPDADAAVVGDGGAWAAQMGWRYVAYREGGGAIALVIEPMVGVPDIVYTPDEQSWSANAPDWARARRAEILARLKSVAWNRDLEWRESQKEKPTFIGLDLNLVVRGSTETTPGGRQLEEKRLFNPSSPVPREKAREMWYEAAREHAHAAKGKVNIFIESTIPNSVFQVIVLPALKENPNVELVFRKVGDD